MNLFEFVDKMVTAFPGASWDVDNDGQIVVYTDLQYTSNAQNPSVPLGEAIVQPFDS